jgi:hypothetical protein
MKESICTGENNIIIGHSNICNHNNCVIIGTNLKTTANNSLLIGNSEIETSKGMTDDEFFTLQKVLYETVISQ